MSLITNVAKLNAHYPICEQIKKNLTHTKYNYLGPPSELKFYSETLEHLIIPRQYAIHHVPEIKFQLHDDLKYKGIVWPKVTFAEGYTYRAGQAESIKSLVYHYNQGNLGGCLNADVGTGKTFMATCIASETNSRTLILVHKDDLLKNWKKLHDPGEAIHFKNTLVGTVRGKKCDYKDKHVVFSTFQTVYSRLDSLPEDFFSNFDLIICDEGHHVPAETFTKVISAFKAKYILAISATFRRKDELDFLVEYYVGPIVHVHKTDKLVGKYFILDVPYETNTNLHNYQKNISNIVDNKNRNALLTAEIVKAYQAGRKILAVSHRLAHCEDIYNRLAALHIPNVSYYVGGMSAKEKEEASKQKILLGTYKMIEEGTDIPDLDTLFILTPKDDLQQTAGRIQRQYKDKKSIIIIIPHDHNSFVKNINMRAIKQLNTLKFSQG